MRIRARFRSCNSGTTLHSIKDVENPSISIDLDKEINTVKVNSENNGQRIQIATEPKASPLGKNPTSAQAKNADINKQKNDSPADKEKGHPVNCITGAVVDTQYFDLLKRIASIKSLMM